MNALRRRSILLVLLLVTSVGWPQYQGPVRSSHERRTWADLPEQHTIHAGNALDLRELKKDADELAELSQGIPADVEAISRGVISGNLHERLKRIEKLSRKLRDAVARGNR
jgi:hypothetical protein